MNLYHMNEADFILPEQALDQSAHVLAYTMPDPFALKSPTLGTPPEFSLIVSRDIVGAEVKLSDYVKQQMPELERNLKAFKVIEQGEVFVDGVAALTMEFTWQSDDGPMRQRQACMIAPLGIAASAGAAKRIALTLTATTREASQAKYAFTFEQILYSLTFRRA